MKRIVLVLIIGLILIINIPIILLCFVFTGLQNGIKIYLDCILQFCDLITKIANNETNN